jgi:hypothetical protein
LHCAEFAAGIYFVVFFFFLSFVNVSLVIKKTSQRDCITGINQVLHKCTLIVGIQ